MNIHAVPKLTPIVRGHSPLVVAAMFDMRGSCLKPTAGRTSKKDSSPRAPGTGFNALAIRLTTSIAYGSIHLHEAEGHPDAAASIEQRRWAPTQRTDQL